MLKIVNHFHTDVSKFDSAALVGDMVKKLQNMELKQWRSLNMGIWLLWKNF